MIFRITPLLAASLCLAASLLPASNAHAQSESTPSEKLPNIVFFLADNTGWGDWGVYGGQVETPNIDHLAAEGMRFTNYNVEVQCTPSRSAIMTGRHPVRSGTYNVLPPPSGGPAGMTPWEYTIAELLSDAGYATALYGKWHLGNIQGRLPNDQGFDEWWGIPNSWEESGYTTYPLYTAMVEEIFKKRHITEVLNTPPHVLEGKKGEDSTIVMELDMDVRPIIDGEYLIPKTIDYIKQQVAANEPFFVYLGYSEMHPPIVCNPEFVGKSTKHSGMYADCIAEMDHRVGQVMAAVKEAGVEDNTIFVLSSDNATDGLSANAGAAGGSNGPFRGNFFYTPYEGSMRVPAIVRWPGKIPSGVVSNEIIAAVDWLPTLAALTGQASLVPTDRPIDGIDFSKLLLGDSKESGREHYMFFGVDGELMSIKWRFYKMVRRGFRDPEQSTLNQGAIDFQLPKFFNLSNDPHEDFNLWDTELTMTWLFWPMLEIEGAYRKSIEAYPNIQPGTVDFKGYPAKH
ncbi:MAG: arylsulfatase [Kiloniellales bacterium]